MAFLAFANEEDQAAFQTLCLSLGLSFTALAAKDREVFAVPDVVLDELVQRDVNFLVLREEEVPPVLTEGGLAHYRLLREKHPEHLYFNAPLPPGLHVTLACTVPEPNLEAVRQIVGRYEPLVFRTEDVVVLRVSPAAAQPRTAFAWRSTAAPAALIGPTWHVSFRSSRFQQGRFPPTLNHRTGTNNSFPPQLAVLSSSHQRLFGPDRTEIPRLFPAPRWPARQRRPILSPSRRAIVEVMGNASTMPAGLSFPPCP
jgi:hypothetical protein